MAAPRIEAKNALFARFGALWRRLHGPARGAS
jgi:hypothetical protein